MNTEALDILIEGADEHARMDHYAQRFGYEFEDGKACSIGCTVQTGIDRGLLPKNTKHRGHADLAELTGVPAWFFHLCDTIFEGLPNDEAIAWTGEYLRGAKDCQDWGLALAGFLYRLLRRNEHERSKPARELWSRVLDGESVKSLEKEFEAAAADALTAVVADAARAASEARAVASAAVWSEARAARVEWRAARVECSKQRLDLLACLRGEYR